MQCIRWQLNDSFSGQWNCKIYYNNNALLSLLCSKKIVQIKGKDVQSVLAAN
jgi:hypothetical protein